MEKIKLGLLFVILVFLTGCASYSATMPMLDRIEDKKIVKAEEIEGVVMTAFPVLTKEDSEKYFGDNLLGWRIFGQRILAVYLDIFNKNSSAVKIAVVRLEIGTTAVSPTDSEEVYDKVKREYAGKALWWTAATLYIGAVPSILHTASVNRRIKKDLKEKEFILDKEIKADSSSEGFIWFQLPERELLSGGLLPADTMLVTTLETGDKMAEYKLLLPSPTP